MRDVFPARPVSFGTIVLAIFLLSAAVTGAGVLNPAPTAKTGQTTSYGPGDDGDLERGVEWPDPRFADNLDGTVTDHLTGLVWLKDATFFSARAWVPALNACSNLADDGVTLTDGSVAGNWRLPNNKELRRLIDFGKPVPALPDGHPFILPDSGSFWSGTTAQNNTGRAWRVEDGTMQNDPKNTQNLVWPVRDSFSGDPGPAPVPKTGQTISYGPRDDGELQEGVAWPDPRFADNMDGTVTDHLTGLIWLRDGTRFADLSFDEALETCNTLGDDGVDLTDGSQAGQWRLPNVWELGSLNDFGQIGPALPADHPFIAGNAGTFWTSTTSADNTNRAWTIGMGIGRVVSRQKGDLFQVWPVRGATPIPVDVEPGDCPNVLELDDDDDDGVIKVAIAGTFDLDVTTIDPVTVRLEGVAPMHSSIKDVTAPFEPFTGKQDCELDCSEEGPDGWPDLVLKFGAPSIADVLAGAVHGECRVLTLTAHLREELGSTPVAGEEIVLIETGDDDNNGDEDGDGDDDNDGDDDGDDDDGGGSGGHRARITRDAGRSRSSTTWEHRSAIGELAEGDE